MDSSWRGGSVPQDRPNSQSARSRVGPGGDNERSNCSGSGSNHSQGKYSRPNGSVCCDTDLQSGGQWGPPPSQQNVNSNGAVHSWGNKPSLGGGAWMDESEEVQLVQGVTALELQSKKMESSKGRAGNGIGRGRGRPVAEPDLPGLESFERTIESYFASRPTQGPAFSPTSPLPEHHKSSEQRSLYDASSKARFAMTVAAPGLALAVEIDPEKIYADEYKKAFDQRVQEVRFSNDSCENVNSVSSRESRYASSARSIGQDTSILGTHVGFKVFVKDQADEVWDQYDMNSFKFSNVRDLAVYKHQKKIMSTLSSQQVMIVEGFTGCGKTTQIPQYIMNEAAAAGKRCNIVVTQPRRIAALSVAQRVCDERGWELGGLVGFQVGLSKRTCPDTRLCYMTTGILLQTLISRKRLDEYSHIIVDEVHERDLETDLLLLVIKKIMVDQADKETKIILMSATLNAEKFADYFPRWRDSIGAGIVRIPPDIFYPITEYYLDTIPKLEPTDINIEGFDEPKIHQGCYEFAKEIILSLDKIDELRSGDSRGGVLVFLPGMMEIDTLYKLLKDHVMQACGNNEEDDKLGWLLLPLHSLISAEEQQRVFRRVEKGCRKIILATNIAESSITVTDITYVIDFCLTKSLSCDPSTNYSCLRMEWASKNQCTQRKGRVGRVSDGFVYRMVPFRFYVGLRDEALPDMEKACLENVVLDVKNLNLGSPKSILALSIDPPKLNGIRIAVANLKQVGALSINSRGHYTSVDGDMTQMGVIMAKLPIDIRLSRLIILGHVFGVLEETVIIAAGLSVKSPFSYPFLKRLIAFMSKLSWSGETYSDCFAILSVYRMWQQKCESSHFRNMGEERGWAKTYFVQLNVMREIHALIQDIMRRLRNVGIQVNHTKLIQDTLNSEQGLLLKVVIAGAFYPNYFIRHRPVPKDYEKSIMRDLAGANALYSVVLLGFPAEQPGELYADSIAKDFMDQNCIPRVIFSSSKAIITNDPRGAKIGQISQNVYKGIKMRQIREPIVVKLMRTDLARDVYVNEMEQEKRIQRMRCPKRIHLPSVRQEIIDIIITHFESIESFYAIYKDKYHYLQEIGRLLKLHSNTLRAIRPTELFEGALCVVEDEGEFYRGRVEFQNKTDVFVYFVDSGKSVWRKPGHIYAISKQLMDLELHMLECQALHFRVYGIKPLARHSSSWGNEISKICSEYIAKFKSVIRANIFSVVEGVVACDLIGDPDSPSLRESLLEDKKVTCVEEPRLSKDNNNVRYRVQHMDSDTDIQGYDDRQEGPDVLFRSMNLPMQNCNLEVTLRGPFTPLEMSFTSLCRSAHLKQVQIEGNSVNSVALDQEPTSNTARLLVAAGVGIAQRSGNVMAKDATLMPAIPGLVGLLAMIFCPKMELRYDYILGRYTGCLSGLGVDPATNEPVFADHDMEINFDTMFNNEDLKSINAIRMTMSVALRNESGFDIANLRSSVRKELQELLERERESVDEEFPQRLHQWGLLKEEQLIPLPTETPVPPRGHCRRGEEVADVFPLHRLVDPSRKPDAALLEAPQYDYDSHSYDWNEGD